MSWHEKLLTTFGSSYFLGISLGEWLGVLRENRFAIAPSCLPRAATISMFSVLNTLLASLENWRFRGKWETCEPEPPLFVLGHYRSGTTHLHNLLAVDERFAYLNAYEATYPRTFLLTEPFNARLVGRFMPRKRPFDNVRLGAGVPYEDEIALTNSTRTTPYMSLVFPKRLEHYERFLSFEAATPEEIARWRAGLLEIVKKLTWKYRRPVVLKSPPHTARVRLLLECFPHARFVHIHRDPYEVIQSTLHLIHKGLPWIRLQNASRVDWTERALRQWREMYEAYFSQRALIPAGRLHEIAFADLEREPVAQLRAMYEALDLPPFEAVEPRIKAYLKTLVGYEKNRFQPLPNELKERIAHTCRRGFEQWGYPL